MQSNCNQRRYFCLFALLIITSPWYLRIAKDSLLLAILLTVNAFTVFYFFLSHKQTKIMPLVVSFLLLFVFSINSCFYQGICKRNRLEKDLLAKRFNYFATDMGLLYRNRVGIMYHSKVEPGINKYLVNTIQQLDLNYYFFGNHPRERSNASEFIKFLPIFLPFFLIGIWHFSKFRSKRKLIYLLIVVTLSGLYRPDCFVGPVIIFPLISVFIFSGIIGAYDLIKK